MLRLASLPSLLLALATLVVPATASAWWSADYAARREITVDPQSLALDASGAKPAVVLVRLHEGVFPFGEVTAEGTDIRFVAADDKTPLAHHVEKFDPVFNLGFVWVALPELKPGAPTKIWMYYGSPAATIAATPAETYDARQLLVYHFSDAAGEPAHDAGPLGVNAATPVSIDDSGLIGGAARFDGSSALRIGSNETLQAKLAGPASWSLWARTASTQPAVLFAHGSGGSSFTIGLDGGRPVIRINGSVVAAATQSIADDAWHHIGVVAGSTLSLYIDGALALAVPNQLPAVIGPITVGAALSSAGSVERGFVGTIDELQIYEGTLSAGWMKLVAANQGTQDRVLSFGAASEAQEASHTSHFAIILHSLTLDAWIAIVVLMIMMVISFVIMYLKASQLGRATRGNREFLALLAKAEGDLLVLNEHLGEHPGERDDSARGDLVRQSPLHQLFETGIREVRHRIPDLGRNGVLGTAAVDSIRAAMETTVVRQSQVLSKLMVLLTIAISGGPFIGLLGTVMGVMITFAAVAAAGDVNINAIAPGIAAALAATVAGLLVAIPALFGYNYLLSRVKECGADMQVFVQEFTTKIAERYSSAGA